MRGASLPAAAVVLALSLPVGAAPDATLREAIKGSIDRGINWLRWQLNPHGTWNDDVYVTADAVRVFAESHRKYVEDDGPFMRHPAAHLRQALQQPKNAIVIGAAVMALKPLKNPSDAATLAAQAGPLKRWIAEAATAVRPVDLEQLALMVMAARAAGVRAGAELLRHVEVLALHGSTNGPIPGFSPALRMHCLLVAGARKNHPTVREHLAGIRKHWGWWSNPEKARASGYPVPPLRYWQALARAMDAYGKPAIEDEAGAAHDWKTELARELVEAQQFDGNWMESRDKISDTINAVSALELIYRQ